MTPERRRLLLRSAAYASGGVLALSAGVGAWWWREGSRRTPVDAAAARLWSASLTAPDGSPLPMSRFAGRPLLLNFWATWCAPCVREMPLLARFLSQHQAQGWQVLGIAADSPAPVQEFVQRLGIRFPVAAAGFEAVQWSRALGNDGGGLPYTVVFDRSGQPKATKAGEVKEADLEAWVALAR